MPQRPDPKESATKSLLVIPSKTVAGFCGNVEHVVGGEGSKAWHYWVRCGWLEGRISKATSWDLIEVVFFGTGFFWYRVFLVVGFFGPGFFGGLSEGNAV